MTEENRIKGKKNRASGKAFELKVRVDLEKKGYIVSKWQNNVDLNENKLVACRPKFNPFTKRIMMNSGGFTDFIAYKRNYCSMCSARGSNFATGFDVMGVECKAGKYLLPEEKEKCNWLIKKGIFDSIWIASKGKGRGEIVYDKFEVSDGK